MRLEIYVHELQKSFVVVVARREHYMHVQLQSHCCEAFADSSSEWRSFLHPLRRLMIVKSRLSEFGHSDEVDVDH